MNTGWLKGQDPERERAEALFLRLHPRVFGVFLTNWVRGYLGRPEFRGNARTSPAHAWYLAGKRARREEN